MDERILKANFIKDSIRDRETVVKIDDNVRFESEWQVIKEESKNSEYEKILKV